MTMPPGLRKLVLTAHVTTSVGWLGAVVGFLALALTGLTSEDAQMVRSTYVAMEIIGRFVLVPLSLATLVTGLVQSLGTPWGVFRHYWVLFKLLITVFATIVLLMYMQTLSALGKIAAESGGSGTGHQELQTFSPVLHAGAALVLLLVAITLSIYKPRGMTPYGRRKQRERRIMPQSGTQGA
jgi:hypothetical protein